MTRRCSVRRAVGGAAVAGLLLAAVAVPVAAAVRDVAVGNFYFDDATPGDGVVTARVGDQLRFTVVGGSGHTVTVEALGIDSGTLSPGATFVTPVLGVPGRYTLICRTHVQRGHTATLTVLAAGAATTTTAPVPPTTTAAGPSTVPDAGPSTSVTSTVDAETDSTATTDATETTVDGGADDAGGVPPVGVVGGDDGAWLRAVWLGLLALPVVALAALVAERRARRRPPTE